MKILKFGGKSLQTGEPQQKTLDIISKEAHTGPVALVVSAIGDSTDRLDTMIDLARNNKSFENELLDFVALQNTSNYNLSLDDIYQDLKKELTRISLADRFSEESEANVLAFGEIISAKIIAHRLSTLGTKANYADSRLLITGREINDEFVVDQKESSVAVNNYFQNLEQGTIPVITGFIAADQHGRTVTLGRNGTNYTASLIAGFIGAVELQNWTDVNGIYSASPKLVPEAQRITHLSYKEAHELANFGAAILHPKTIGPLIEKEIPLKIFNSFDQNQQGTLIDKNGAEKGIKAVSVLEDVALISIEGKGLLGKVGIDARVFTALSKRNISVRLISQASSERGIGFVVDAQFAQQATAVLSEEFAFELIQDQISKISYNTDMAIIAIVGRHNYSLEKAIRGLRLNKIWMYLISNSISGEHISLVVDNKNLRKAVNIVHSQVFGVIKTINLFAFGKGNVGANLIDQILATREEVVKRRNLRIRVIGIADSQRYIFNESGLSHNWREELAKSNASADCTSIIDTLENSVLENIVIADNTSSQEVANCYLDFLNHQIDIVASNKKANSGSYETYSDIRKILKRRGRLFFYETNVGAGLPIIDTLKHLYDSADQVVKLRGVFSGSLSYIFNNFSERAERFSNILAEAKENGFTEPNPIEDLLGSDVARKLIILARELGLKVDSSNVQMQNLLPEELSSCKDFNELIDHRAELDSYYKQIKEGLKEDTVLRYVAELDVEKTTLSINLEAVARSTALGSIKNADALFEIFTESYGDDPIIIQGAGAGGEVTARGVYSDLIRLGHKY